MRSEFQFINDMKSRYDLRRVGDDCAVLPKDDKTDLLITSDMLVEEVDFRLDWSNPEQIGHKCLAVSLSDIAAMGGTARFAMLSIAVVENLWKGDLLDRFYEGWNLLAAEFGVELIGGDISSTSGPLTVDSTVIGEVPRGQALLRAGARPGDAIFVTGSLGGAAGGLQLLLRGQHGSSENAQKLLERQLTPRPELLAANQLRTHGLATAAIDLSDGLSSDLMHICEASGVGAEIDARSLPIEPALKEFFSAEECIELALNGGEDLRLLFTGDAERISAFGLAGVTQIGTVTSRSGRIELLDRGELRPISAAGYRHF